MRKTGRRITTTAVLLTNGLRAATKTHRTKRRRGRHGDRHLVDAEPLADEQRERTPASR